jgi:hypothetical protein
VFGAAAPVALASDPLPGDSVAPPLNSNLIMVYDEYQNENRFGGQPGNPHGPDAKHDTRFEGNFFVFRYVHDFGLEGHNAGVQVFLPYVTYLGGQQLGINDLGSARPGLLPSLGRGSINLSKTNGFAQPNFGAFLFPVANRETGTYFMIGPWIAPPVSSFNKNNNLNANQNVWTFEAEFSLRTELIGTPDTPNLALVLWEENYFYLDNRNSAVASDVISASSIPPIYQALGVTNPVKVRPAANATFREQPTTEFRAYLPYTLIPASRTYIAPGLFEAFGGKQTYKLNGGGIVDSGNRTQETQLRLVVSSFVTPSLQLLLAMDYDVAAHGTPYTRAIEIRVLKEF